MALKDNTDNSRTFSLLASRYSYLHVWKRALLTLRLKRAFGNLSHDIKLFGTANEVIDVGSYEDIIRAKQLKELALSQELALPWYLFSPKTSFFYVWNLLIAGLLVYTATYMPYRIAFQDPVYFDGITLFETIVDFIFIADILVTCLSSYKNDKGEYEASLKVIMIAYLRTWFFIDVFSSFPMGLAEFLLGYEGSSQNMANRLARLTRLPRVYKLVRILRLSKLSQVYKGNPFYEEMQDWFDVNGKFLRFIKFAVQVILFIHFFACFFYFAARIENLSPDTWIYKLGFQDKSEFSLYLTSFYWATATITTIGYGDIHAFTEVEMVICGTAMALGIWIYSMIISSITSLLTSIDIREAEISSKVRRAQEFGIDAGLNRATIKKISQVIRHNATMVSNDSVEILENMPKTLRLEIALQMYNGIARTMPMFLDRDSSFIVYVMMRLKPIFCEEFDFLYHEEDSAEQLFVIIKGQVNLTIPDSVIGFKSYLKGTNFGELEILANCSRIDNASVNSNAELLSLSRGDFLTMLEEFPTEALRMRQLAYERLTRNNAAKLNLMRRVGCREDVIQKQSSRHYSILKDFKTVQEVSESKAALKRMQILGLELFETISALENEVMEVRHLASSSKEVKIRNMRLGAL
jgi:hyperpolarization activated cyclic nucleotide-gated potassium channel 1